MFAGTRSIGKVANAIKYRSFSTDLDNRHSVDLHCNILELQKEQIPFEPDIIWASPPCTAFSVASIGRHWYEAGKPKTEAALLGMKLVERTLEIISWYPNAIWYIENPRGMLRKLPMAMEIPAMYQPREEQELERREYLEPLIELYCHHSCASKC